MASYKRADEYYAKTDIKNKITKDYSFNIAAGTPLTYVSRAGSKFLFQIKNTPFQIEIEELVVEYFIATFIEEANRSAK